MKKSILCAVIVACALIQGPSTAVGRINESGGPSPNPPICTGSQCIFLNEIEYAQNGIGIALRDDAIFQKIVAQGQARSLAVVGAPLGMGIGDKKWWFDWVKVRDVTQEVQLETPTRVNSTDGITSRFPARYRNCGSQASETTVESTVRTRDEITKEIEETITSFVSSERELSLTAGYGDAVSASAKSKATSSLQNFRRNFIKTLVEHEFITQTTDPIRMPPNSLVERTVVQKSSIDTYVAKGTVTTDAVLYLPVVRDIPIGRWSDFASKRDRQIDIEGTTRVLVRDTEYVRSTQQFASEKECRADQ